jgi:hypothetical protein
MIVMSVRISCEGRYFPTHQIATATAMVFGVFFFGEAGSLAEAKCFAKRSRNFSGDALVPNSRPNSRHICALLP